LARDTLRRTLRSSITSEKSRNETAYAGRLKRSSPARSRSEISR
jgi:hypothetical protein